jgi:hypothetical protein
MDDLPPDSVGTVEDARHWRPHPLSRHLNELDPLTVWLLLSVVECCARLRFETGREVLTSGPALDPSSKGEDAG